MSSFFNQNAICASIDSIDKLERHTILPEEHSDLRKIIAAAAISQHYAKEEDTISKELLNRYYYWLSQNWKNDNQSLKEKTDLFLFKCALENTILGHPTNAFEQLSTLAEIWRQPLKRERTSICNFLSFFMYKVYGIHLNLIENIFSMINSPWKPVLSPLANILSKNLSLEEIERYFFGNQTHNKYSIEILPDMDRFFSVTSSAHENYIFLPKKENFDLFEAALVVHEFQHIQNAVNERDRTSTAACGLFDSEKSSLHAEKIFLHSAGTGKRGKYCWLESNLFYPLILLQCELENLISEKPLLADLKQICESHNIKFIPISSLFQWQSPFQMAVYTAAAMDLEPSWKKFLAPM